MVVTPRADAIDEEGCDFFNAGKLSRRHVGGSGCSPQDNYSKRVIGWCTMKGRCYINGRGLALISMSGEMETNALHLLHRTDVLVHHDWNSVHRSPEVGIADDDGGAKTVTMAKINGRNTFRDRSANIDNSAGSRWTKSLGIRILAGVVRGRAKGAFAGLKNDAGSFDLPSHSATPVLSINVCFS